MKRIMIVGGGFAGVACALRLAKVCSPEVKVVLVSKLSHFEFHAALYRVVTGRTPLEVCIPLSEIFDPTDIEVVEDEIVSVDTQQQILRGSSECKYSYDYLVLALGSQTVFYDTPGLQELSFGFRSIQDALALKKHLHQLFEACSYSPTKDEIVCNAHIIIVGGGATGTEVAGELAVYAKKLAQLHGIHPSYVTIDLIQSPNRLLPDLPPAMSAAIEKQVRSLGVNVYLNRRLVKEEVENVYLKDMKMKSKTVIWCAGVQPHQLYSEIDGLLLDKAGRVLVNKNLKAKQVRNVYIAGDGAALAYGGMAQTALRQGHYIGYHLSQRLKRRLSAPFEPKPPIYAIPVGPGWAVIVWGKLKIYGTLGWWLRRVVDLYVFGWLLPWRKALIAFQAHKTLCETCSICSRGQTHA